VNAVLGAIFITVVSNALNLLGISYFKLPRCLVWVIAKLTHAWDIQIELTGSVIGGGSEVDEVSKRIFFFIRCVTDCLRVS
jgi:hypothetical protein